MKKIIVLLTFLFGILFSSCKKTADPAPENSYTGKLSSSGSVSFKGLCMWSVEYNNSTFDIKLDNKKQTVLSATVSTTMKENVLSGSCIPLTQQSQHLYTLSSATVNGSNLLIYFKQDSNSFPQNTASFIGNINATSITGLLTFYRISDGIFCKVEMPFQILKN
jgi:hypothetical protein